MNSSDKGGGLEISYLEELIFFDNLFTYRDKKILYKDIKHLEFTATVTKHSVNFIPTGTSYDAQLFVHLRGSSKLHIEHRKGLFRTKQKEKFNAMMRAVQILSDITFTQRVQIYENQITSRGFATWGEHQIAKNGDLFKNYALKFNIKTGDVNFRIGPFHAECSKKKPSIAERLKGIWGESSEILDISIDRDCFIYILKHYLNLSWSNEAIPKKRLFGKEAFYRAMLILGAQLCKADGHVSPEEIFVFKKYFGIDDHTFPGAGKIFMEAINTQQSIPEISSQIYDIFDGKEEPLKYIIIGLLQIASADGNIDPNEMKIIRNVGKCFHYTDQEIERLFTIFSETNNNQSSNYNHRTSQEGTNLKYLTILGLSGNATFDEMKSAYRDLARQHHPDLLRAQGIPVDEIAMAEDVLKVINEAYEWLSKNHYAKSQ